MNHLFSVNVFNLNLTTLFIGCRNERDDVWQATAVFFFKDAVAKTWSLVVRYIVHHECALLFKFKFFTIQVETLCIKIKQWPLAPNSQKWQITCANVSRRVTFLSKIAFGDCGRIWRVPQMATFWWMRVWRVFKMLLASLANLGTYIS